MIKLTSLVEGTAPMKDYVDTHVSRWIMRKYGKHVAKIVAKELGSDSIKYHGRGQLYSIKVPGGYVWLRHIYSTGVPWFQLSKDDRGAVPGSYKDLNYDYPIFAKREIDKFKEDALSTYGDTDKKGYKKEIDKLAKDKGWNLKLGTSSLKQWTEVVKDAVEKYLENK